VGEGVAVADAATGLGVSIDTMRRRVKRREVEAQQVASPKGPAWRVRIDTLLPAAKEDKTPRSSSNGSTTDVPVASAPASEPASAPEMAVPAPPSPAEPLSAITPIPEARGVRAPSVDAPRLDLPSMLAPLRQETQPATSDAAIELVRLVGRLQEENRFLAGQVGFLQAQLDLAREVPNLLRATRATTDGRATQHEAHQPAAAAAASPARGGPGQVLVDAAELEELRRIRDDYEAETGRLAQEVARVQALMEELEEEDSTDRSGQAGHMAGAPGSASTPSAVHEYGTTRSAPTEPSATPRRAWWRPW